MSQRFHSVVFPQLFQSGSPVWKGPGSCIPGEGGGCHPVLHALPDTGLGAVITANGRRRWPWAWKTRLPGSESLTQIAQGRFLPRVPVELPKNGNWRLQRAEHGVGGSRGASCDRVGVLTVETQCVRRTDAARRVAGYTPGNHPFRSQFQITALNLRGNTKVGLNADQGAEHTSGS
eukprot:3483713-Prymnesium_polylepis.2